MDLTKPHQPWGFLFVKLDFYLAYVMINHLIQAMDCVVNICIGGVLDSQVCIVDADKFTSDLDIDGKASKYYKQRYIKNKMPYIFWIDQEFDFHEATKRVKQILEDK